MTAETEAIKAQILSTGNAEILLEENDFLIVKWIKPEIKYSMAAYQYGKTGMANNYPWECSLTEEQIAFFLEHINAAVEYFKSKHHYFHLEVKEVSYENIVSIDEHGIKFSDLHWLTYKEWNVNVKPCAYEMSAAFLLYKKMPLPENKLFKKNGNRIRTEAADCAKICMKCITKI